MELAKVACFCEDGDTASSSSSSSSCSSRSSCGRPGCCCHYDPFADDSPESRIRDLPFALRKLAVMKCQMKKWRLERLELESQTRSLRQALQSHGVEPAAILKPDPVLVHLRADNARLERRGQELEDEVRDLAETLADRECCEDNPCDAVAYLKEKMLAVRHRCAVEKRHMRETIAELQVKLQAAQDEGSCAALNRLRAKLRELTSERRAGDSEAGTADRLASSALEKSIETMAELSGSCDELRRENERLLAEVETLKREIKEDVGAPEKFADDESLERESGEISDLSRRVKACESVASQMRLQLAEKDDVINELQKKLFSAKQNSNRLEHDLEQMALGQKASSAQIETMKAELSEKDDKITQLLRELRKSSELVLDVSELESQLERARSAMLELEAMRDELTSELEMVRRKLTEKNEEIERLLSEKNAEIDKLRVEQDETRRHSEADALERERKHSLEMDDMKRELGTLAVNSKSLKKLEADVEVLKLDNQSLKESNNKLNDQLREALANVDRLNNALESLRNENIESSQQLKAENECLLNVLKDLEEQVRKAEAEKERLLASEQALRASTQDGRAEVSRARDEMTSLRSENATLQRTSEELTRRLRSAEDALEEALGDLGRACVAGGELKAQLEEASAEAAECRSEGSRLREEIERLKAADDAASKQIAELQAKLNAIGADKDRLERELGDHKWQLDKLKKEHETTETTDNDELARLKAEHAALQAEAVQLKKDIEALNTDNKQLRQDGEVARADVERLKAEVNRTMKLSTKPSSAQSQDAGDSARSAKELKASRTENEQLKGAAPEGSVKKDKIVDGYKNEDEVIDKSKDGHKDKKNVKDDIEKSEGSRKDKDLRGKDEIVEKSKNGDTNKETIKDTMVESESSRKDKDLRVKDEGGVKSKAEDTNKETIKDTMVKSEGSRKDKDLKVKDEVGVKSKGGDKDIGRQRDTNKIVAKREDSKKNKDTRMRGETVDKHRTNERDRETIRDRNKREYEEKEKEKLKDKGDVEIKRGSDFMQAREALKAEMEMQIEAVDRVRDFINYAEGKLAEKPTMLADLIANGNDKKDWSASEMSELFKTSRLLSEAIVRTEEKAQDLGGVQKNLRTEDNTIFDAESWLQSLTLSELAELHARICLATGSLVEDDGCCRCPEPAERQVGARMAALRRRIDEKQREAAARANEMHRTLMLEQARLIRIADDVNRGRELNLAMRLCAEAGAILPVDVGAASCCAREDCARVGCTAGDSGVWRRK